MPRGPNVRQDIKNEIIKIKVMKPNLIAKEILEQLKEELESRNALDRCPSLRMVQKILREYELGRKVTNPLDAPWHLGALLDTLRDNPLPLDRLPYIFSVQRYQNHEVSVRQARWIVYLCAFPDMGIDDLATVSFYYTLLEIVSHGKPDTRWFDKWLNEGKFGEKAREWWNENWNTGVMKAVQQYFNNLVKEGQNEGSHKETG